jgi:hypothetical protein
MCWNFCEESGVVYYLMMLRDYGWMDGCGLTWQAQLLRDAGRGDEAVAGFDETLQADKAYVQVRRNIQTA